MLSSPWAEDCGGRVCWGVRKANRGTSGNRTLVRLTLSSTDCFAFLNSPPPPRKPGGILDQPRRRGAAEAGRDRFRRLQQGRQKALVEVLDGGPRRRRRRVQRGDRAAVVPRDRR